MITVVFFETPQRILIQIHYPVYTAGVMIHIQRYYFLYVPRKTKKENQELYKLLLTMMRNCINYNYQ